ncbi:MAG TPA: retropepsin-like aspartic protease, partial [Opitutaceae bacterium]|nr:retropepsin-like aspartic protease [Opitutaceae bacterium]
MRAVIATTVLSMALGLAGCSAGPGAHARVAKAPAPPLAASGVAPALSKDHPLSGWTLGRAERDDPEELIKWAAAREAFWNYDTDQAVKLLRELREEKVVNDDHFADLVRQCYASSGRWLDAAAIYAELGSEQDHSELLQYLRFRAGLPEMELAFAAGAAPVPFALKHGALVTVQAEINGRPARLLVDTGCGMTWVAESFARQAGVQIFEQTISLSDSNGRERPVPVGQVQRLQVGGFTVRNLPIIMSSSLFMALG